VTNDGWNFVIRDLRQVYHSQSRFYLIEITGFFFAINKCRKDITTEKKKKRYPREHE